MEYVALPTKFRYEAVQSAGTHWLVKCIGSFDRWNISRKPNKGLAVILANKLNRREMRKAYMVIV